MNPTSQGFGMELAVGPMSTEIIAAAFRFSNFNRKPLMLIASKNQIDHSGGYVNGWTTRQYMDEIRRLREMYPQAQVKICRDHCGPGFNGDYGLEDTYKTIEDDIAQGFDFIHIDFCHFQGSKEEQLKATEDAIKHCLKLNPNIQLEIGTDENTGANYSLPNLAEWEEEIDYIQQFCKPEFYVVQTGSLVKEINQVGNFNKSFVEEVSEMLKRKGLKLKEHNADYLTRDEIAERSGIVDAQNIAPQLGVIQTKIVFSKCLMYGIPIDDFVETVYEGGKWKKWLYRNTEENKMLCVLIAGHYHFNSPAYKEIERALNECEDLHESIVTEMEKVYAHYLGG